MYVLTKKREADRKSATSSTFVPHRNDYIRQNPAWSAGAALPWKPGCGGSSTSAARVQPRTRATTRPLSAPLPAATTRPRAPAGR